MTETHTRFEELAAGHALDALEPGDEQAFLAHVHACAACERAVAMHRETAAQLAYAADPVDLPDSLLAGIRAGMGAAAVDAARPVQLDAERARRRTGTLPKSWLAVAAAAALVLTLGVWNGALRHGQSVSDERASRLTAAVRLLEHGQQVRLADERGRAVAIAVLHDQRVSLVVSGLPVNDRARSTYVLWQTGDTGTRPVGTFDVRGASVDVVRDLPLTSLQGWTALAITREPGRTAPRAPGSIPVANGPRPA